MIKSVLCFLLFFAPCYLFAQSINKEYETHAAWEVTQIDEFVERFDNVDTTKLKVYLAKHDPTIKLTREKLIKGLFNGERKDWNFNEIAAFIQLVNDKDNPVHLDFYKGNWYADVKCSVLWNGRAQTATFKLKIQEEANGGYKWVFMDADAKFLMKKNANGVMPKISQPVLPTPQNNAYLSPMSHAIDFFNIDKVSENSKNIGNYLAKSDKYSDNFCLFIDECIKGHLKIMYVKTIKYTCSQVKGWTIEIKQFDRQTNNSGWLISKLIKLPS